MKNVFILTNDMNGGGAERVLLTLLKHLPREDYQITLGLVYRRGPHLSEIPEDIPTRFLFDETAQGTTTQIRTNATALYQRIAPPDSDIEIAFLEGTATKIIGAGTNHRAKKIAWVHIDMNRFHYTSYLYNTTKEELDTYQVYDKLVFVSHDVQVGFEALFGCVMREHSTVQYNPIDEDDVIHLSQAFPVPKHGLTLCASGRLVPEKGFNRLLNVVKRLQEEKIIFDLWILGEGPEQNALKDYARQLPRSEAVSFLGFRQNPYPYMRAADIFVSSSSVEGFSMVIGEALVLGRRIVAMDCCGMREALQNGTYGILVDNNEDSLFRGLKQEILSPSLLKVELSSEQRFAPYSMRQRITEIIQLLESL